MMNGEVRSSILYGTDGSASCITCQVLSVKCQVSNGKFEK